MDLGEWGENVAVRFFKRKGYRILETNYRFDRTELDLIVQKEAVIVFVEVKTRRNLVYGVPAEAVTKTKQYHIRKAINYYLAHNLTRECDMRIDVIEILRMAGRTYIRHIENAF